MRDHGFTLLEVLVALAVLGLSLGVLTGVFSVALDRLHEARMRSRTLELAQTLLLQAETAQTDAPYSGRDGAVRWQVAQTPYGSDEDRKSWRARPFAVAVTVAWQDHGRERSVALQGLHLVALP